MRVAVICGGPSSEAEVSRASAADVRAALVTAGHDVVAIELDRHTAITLEKAAVDVVFPVVHGAVGEDGCLQGLLEVLGLPYVGSGVTASALAMDKALARKLFHAEGLPVAAGLAVACVEDALSAARRARAVAGRAVVVKPSSNGSAIGVLRFEADAPDEEVAAALQGVWAIDSHALVEHFAKGREVTCSVLDIDGPRALVATEIASPKDAFYTYEARYAPGRSKHTCPAELDVAMTERVHSVAVRAHEVLGCRDLSRVDFVVGDAGDPNALTLLEVNTIPGMTPTSLFPEAAAAAGLRFPVLCDTLVRHAHERGAQRRNNPRPFPTK